MQVIRSGGVPLHVRDEGPRDGRVVMFSNSLGSDLRVWDLMLPHLPPGLRIIRYDKRGHGLSGRGAPPYDMAELVSDAETIIDTLGLTRLTWVGLSIGGLIGQGLAARRPEVFEGLALMDTAAKIGTAEMWQERIDAVLAGGVEGMADAILARWFMPDFLNSDAVAPWAAMLSRTDARGYAGACSAIAGADFTETTRALTMPVIAMAGAEDISTPPALVEATAQLCGAPFHMIENAVHIPCVEQPEATAQLITNFLKETGDV